MIMANMIHLQAWPLTSVLETMTFVQSLKDTKSSCARRHKSWTFRTRWLPWFFFNTLCLFLVGGAAAGGLQKPFWCSFSHLSFNNLAQWTHLGQRAPSFGIPASLSGSGHFFALLKRRRAALTRKAFSETDYISVHQTWDNKMSLSPLQLWDSLITVE